jgi:putative ABC transport system permease protein
MLKFALRNVARKKGVAIIASFGIGFGLMLMFTLGAFSAGVAAQFEDNYAEVLGIVEVTEYGNQGATSQLPPAVLETILESEAGSALLAYNYQAIAPPYFTIPSVGEIGNDGDRLTIVGVNQSVDAAYGGATSVLQSGRAFSPGEAEVIVDSRLADLAAGPGLNFSVALGSDLEFFLDLGGTETRNVTIVGVYEQEDSGAPSFVPRSYFAYIDLQVLWDLLEDAGETPGLYSSIQLRFPATSNEEAQAYIAQVEALDFGSAKIEAFSPASFQSAIQESLGVLDTFISVISVITALAGGMAIIVSQLTSVAERMKEFAILKSTGWKNRHIFKDVVYESLILGAMGALIGIGLGLGLIQVFSSGVGPFGSIRVEVTPALVVQVVSYALSIGVVGGLYPGLKAARVRPVKVLKGD